MDILIVSAIIVLVVLIKNMGMVNKLIMKNLSWIIGLLILINAIFGIYAYSMYASLIEWQFPSRSILVADTVLNIIGSIAVIMLFNKEASKQELKLTVNDKKISESL